MGFSRKRAGKDGKSRYTAYYLDIRGQERSAGTFSNKKEANDAWKAAEAQVKAGRQGDPGRGRQTFHAYVHDKWLPDHLLEPGVRTNYAGQIAKHLDPFFGPMKMRDILPEHVRQWVTHMHDKGASARTIQYCKGSILNAIFTTALDDEVVTIHPSRGVKTPPVPAKPRRIITASQFSLLYEALPGADAQLLVETAIESGLRWGELAELRAGDLDIATRILTVSRAVIELGPNDHPGRGRFLVKDYPGDWFRHQVWYPARRAAGLGSVRFHVLRHAHASWLLAGGADLQVVKERLGHASIATTGKYLHSLPTADETALDALTKIRNEAQTAVPA